MLSACRHIPRSTFSVKGNQKLNEQSGCLQQCWKRSSLNRPNYRQDAPFRSHAEEPVAKQTVAEHFVGERTCETDGILGEIFCPSSVLLFKSRGDEKACPLLKEFRPAECCVIKEAVTAEELEQAVERETAGFRTRYFRFIERLDCRGAVVIVNMKENSCFQESFAECRRDGGVVGFREFLFSI